MDKKLQQRLFRKYPVLFRDRNKSSSETRMCEGICCGDGWYNLIDEACEQLSLIQKKLGITTVFVQIKEKLAGLRLHAISDLELTSKQEKTIYKIIRTILDHTMSRSYYVCEKCGGYRKKYKELNGWYYAMCDDCWKKFKKEKR